MATSCANSADHDPPYQPFQVRSSSKTADPDVRIVLCRTVVPGDEERSQNGAFLTLAKLSRSGSASEAPAGR